MSCCLLGLTSASYAAAFLTMEEFDGTTKSRDGWDTLNSTAFPGYGTHPGAGAWPAPIGSNSAGSGDAGLTKIAGNGYLSTNASNSYIYSTLSGAQAANASPSNAVGTFSVLDDTSVANLNSVVFQIQLSYWTNVGQPFPTGILPTLSYNGGSQNLAANFSNLTYTGAFTSDYGSGIADYWAFQWDLSGVTETITSFNVNYAVTNHAQVYALQLDQSDGVFNQSIVPEPSRALLLISGMALLGFRRNRRHSCHSTY